MNRGNPRLPAHGDRRCRIILTWLTLSPLFVVVFGNVGWAQRDRSAPSLAYQATFSILYDGEYRDALKEFQAEARGAIKTVQSRWIDSICYETMVGECYYHMGYLDKALEHYTAGLELYAAFSDWMMRVQFPPAIQPSAQQTTIPWGRSSRRSRIGRYQSEMLISQGRIDNNDVVKQGGIVQQAVLYPIRVEEIVRCTCLAMRRREEILGPASPHDPLSARLAAALSRRPGPPNHWSEAWIDVQLGIALMAIGKEGQAVPFLQRSVVAAGEYDHPLTSTALLVLGRIALRRGDLPAAGKFFEEASYSAMHYPNGEVLEESLRYGAMTHLLANGRGIYPPLPAAIRWAKVKDLRQLRASLLLSAAENYAVLGQSNEAAAMLDDARLTIGRREMGSGRIGGRLSYLTALVAFQQKRIAEGDAALAAAMNYMRRGSFWLFQIGLADGLYTSGAVTPRIAMDLYEHILRDPTPTDWTIRPMESMAVLLTPHEPAMEHWFEVALSRRAHEKALEIADRTRRHRFFTALAFGGRLQALRWMLEGPPRVLDQQAQLQRRDLLVRYPGYDQLAQQSQAVRAELKAMPLVNDDPELHRRQEQGLAQLAALSVRQEALLREIALRREPASLVFPPLRSVQELQQRLAPGQAMLAFFATSRHLYGFLMNRENYTYWQIGSPAMLSRHVIALLRAMGHYQSNYELSTKELRDTAWKKPAEQVLASIIEGSRADFTQPFDELVIVPDGLLWYVPFEALQVVVDDKSHPLISRFRIRYAPLASLAVPTGRFRAPEGSTAVVVGKLFPRDEDAVAQEAFGELAEVVPGAMALRSPLPGPSAVYASLFDRLIVLDDLGVSGEGPLGWSPVPLDRNKPGGSLSDWLALPWGGPEEVILPGFHTAAEDSLKGMNRAAPGREIFQTICGLMSSGTQTVLLSRWRMGGQSSFRLIREFTQELPHTSPADAWQRAVFLAAASRVDLEAEPRIKRTPGDEILRGNHPMFWAGYMLVDPGVTPKQEPSPAEAPAEEPVLRVRPDMPQR